MVAKERKNEVSLGGLDESSFRSKSMPGRLLCAGNAGHARKASLGYFAAEKVPMCNGDSATRITRCNGPIGERSGDPLLLVRNGGDVTSPARARSNGFGAVSWSS